LDSAAIEQAVYKALLDSTSGLKEALTTASAEDICQIANFVGLKCTGTQVMLILACLDFRFKKVSMEPVATIRKA
jgi:hypothetical protein